MKYMLRRGDDLLRCKTLDCDPQEKLSEWNQCDKFKFEFCLARFRWLTLEFMTVYTFAQPMNGRRPWPLR